MLEIVQGHDRRNRRSGDGNGEWVVEDVYLVQHPSDRTRRGRGEPHGGNAARPGVGERELASRDRREAVCRVTSASGRECPILERSAGRECACELPGVGLRAAELARGKGQQRDSDAHRPILTPR